MGKALARAGRLFEGTQHRAADNGGETKPQDDAAASQVGAQKPRAAARREALAMMASGDAWLERRGHALFADLLAAETGSGDGRSNRPELVSE